MNESTPSMADKMATIVTAELAKETPVIEAPKPDEKPALVAPVVVQSEKADDEPPIVEEDADDDDEVDEGASESDDDDDTDEDAKPAEPSAAMVAALKKYGVALDLTEVPEPARAPLIKKLAAMEAGYTKAMQDARSYRAEKAEFEAAKDYETKQTEKHIADLLDKDPTLLEKVNAEVEKRTNPTYREALELQRQAAKDRASTDAQARAQQEADRDAQVAQLNSYVVSAVKNAKVPFALVEDAIVRADTAKYQAGNGFLTEAEIDAIVTAKAQVYHRGLSGAKGAERRKYVEDKLEDKRANKNTRKPSGSGVTPPVVVDQSKLSLAEKFAATLAAVGA